MSNNLSTNIIVTCLPSSDNMEYYIKRLSKLKTSIKKTKTHTKKQ